mmetsp:Transcript_6727/g.9312  ORF Transcript_6727/g.9312 Transcript_6727/m.9312 type:complete len:180 (+) Transcript_6727:390-929(+)
MLDLNHLYQAFEKFGPVDRVKTVKPRKGQTRYCGFVNMTYLVDAHQAIKTLSKVRNYTLMQQYFGKAVADEIGDGYLVLRFVGDINTGTSEPSSGANSQYANFQRISSDLRMLRQQLAVLQRIPNVPSTMYSHHPGFWPVPPSNQPPPSTAMMHWQQPSTAQPPPPSIQPSSTESGQAK